MMMGDGLMWVALVVVGWAVGGAKGVRTNIVAEVPTLDVGPLVTVTVAEGDTARLPCRVPSHPDDTLNLVLWYLNHTTRPVLSYDARAKIEPTITADTTKSNVYSSGNSSTMSNKSNSGSSSSGDMISDGGRRLLGKGGTSLVIENVRDHDQAEYRCGVHFKLSPTWTQRLLLVVKNKVNGLLLEDSAGRRVDHQVGPVAEGANITLTCQATHGSAAVVSLSWLLDGEEIDSTWAAAGEGVAVNQVRVSGIEARHRNAQLTCRLITGYQDQPGIAANITDHSATIAMFYVPEASIVAEGGVVMSSGGREVKEGEGLTFHCSVNADPPVYNITWLHNGRVVVVGGRRWMRDNSSLVVSPVGRDDAGLYTCLASNREGDGHSNAVLIRVTHPPYCAGTPNRKLVVASNTTVTLTCQVEAVPEDLHFTWKIGSPPPTHPHLKGLEDDPHIPPTAPRHSGAITLNHAATNEVTWDTPWHGSWEIQGEESTELETSRDSSHPDRSSVTLTPTSSIVVGCFVKNRIGHIKVPCTFTLTVVEPPRPLQDCNVTVVGVTRMEVKCEEPVPVHNAGDGSHDNAQGTHIQQQQHSPSLSFVRSPGASTHTNLEVWTEDTLLVNTSAARPVFTVQGLPPDAALRLVLYTATPQARSTPLYLYARTRPRKFVYLTAPPATQPTQPATEREEEKDDGKHEPRWVLRGVGWEVGVSVGVVGVILLVVAAVAARAWGRRRANRDPDTPTSTRDLQPHSQDDTLHTTPSDGSLSDITRVMGCEAAESSHHDSPSVQPAETSHQAGSTPPLAPLTYHESSSAAVTAATVVAVAPPPPPQTPYQENPVPIPTPHAYQDNPIPIPTQSTYQENPVPLPTLQTYQDAPTLIPTSHVYQESSTVLPPTPLMYQDSPVQPITPATPALRSHRNSPVLQQTQSRLSSPILLPPPHTRLQQRTETKGEPGVPMVEVDYTATIRRSPYPKVQHHVREDEASAGAAAHHSEI